MIFPCKNCKSRMIGCHVTCEKYQKAKIIKKGINEQRRIDSILGFGFRSYKSYPGKIGRKDAYVKSDGGYQ